MEKEDWAMFLPVSLFGESRKLRKFSGSFEHLSLIEMRNALLSKNLISLQHFHDEQIKPI